MTLPRDPPLTALAEVLDSDGLRRFSQQKAELTAQEVIPLDEVRHSLESWAVTMRLQSSPDWDKVVRRAWDAIESGAIYEGLDDETRNLLAQDLGVETARPSTGPRGPASTDLP